MKKFSHISESKLSCWEEYSFSALDSDWKNSVQSCVTQQIRICYNMPTIQESEGLFVWNISWKLKVKTNHETTNKILSWYNY